MGDEGSFINVLCFLTQGQADPLNSAFHLTYNMVLNLLRVEEVNPEIMLEKSFYQFQNYASVPGMIDSKCVQLFWRFFNFVDFLILIFYKLWCEDGIQCNYSLFWFSNFCILYFPECNWHLSQGLGHIPPTSYKALVFKAKLMIQHLLHHILRS